MLPHTLEVRAIISNSTALVIHGLLMLHSEFCYLIHELGGKKEESYMNCFGNKAQGIIG